MAEFRFDSKQRSFIEGARIARLATNGPRGRPHLVPVCFALLGDMLFIPIDEKPKSTTRLARIRDIERDARVTLLVDHYEEDWERLVWVRIDGLAEVKERGD